MRAGRLPEDHPLEQEARAQLRRLSDEALEAIRRQETELRQQSGAGRPAAPRSKPNRWEYRPS